MTERKDHCVDQVSAVQVSISVQWAAVVSKQPSCVMVCDIVLMVLMKIGMQDVPRCLLLVCDILLIISFFFLSYYYNQLLCS